MKIKEIIIVEGKSDTKRLKSFFDVDTYETQGLALNKEDIEYIRLLNNKRGVILLLDPDNPGEKIRKKLNDNIKDLKNAFLIADDARNKNKVGVEHASKEALEKALNNIITYKEINPSLTIQDLYHLDLMGKSNSKDKRKIISKHYSIGNCNSKTMLKRLNMLEVNYNDIVEVLK